MNQQPLPFNTEPIMDTQFYRRQEVLTHIEKLNYTIPETWAWNYILINLAENYYDVPGLYLQLTKEEMDYVRKYHQRLKDTVIYISERILKHNREPNKYSRPSSEDRAMRDILQSKLEDISTIFDDEAKGIEHLSQDEINKDPFWWIPSLDLPAPPLPIEEETRVSEYELEMNEVNFPSFSG